MDKLVKPSQISSCLGFHLFVHIVYTKSVDVRPLWKQVLGCSLFGLWVLSELNDAQSLVALGTGERDLTISKEMEEQLKDLELFRGIWSFSMDQ